eukprot:jgi/Botrbrau1/19033/Bobra.0100s0061.1
MAPYGPDPDEGDPEREYWLPVARHAMDPLNMEKSIWPFKSDPNGIKGRYMGPWRNGCPEDGGWGKFGNSELTYEGQWHGGRMHGQGECTWKVNLVRNTYKGEWKDNAMHGHGEWTRTNNCPTRSVRSFKYIGNWKCGGHSIYNGQGEITWRNGDWCKGVWKGGIFSGLGIRTYTYNWSADSSRRSKTRYIGGMIVRGDNPISMVPCLGEWFYPDGSRYKGESSNEMSQACDILSLHSNSPSPNGLRECTLHGNVLGEYKYANGDIYRGEMKNGKCHGLGEYIWKNGNRYKGEFQYDKFHGLGEFTGDPRPFLQGDPNFGAEKISLDWRKYKGGWQNGRFHGLGSITYLNGIKTQGQFSEGKVIYILDARYHV